MSVRNRRKKDNDTNSNHNEVAEKLADELSNKVYGQEKVEPEKDKLVRSTFMISEKLLREIEQITYQNKLDKKPLKSVSEFVRQSIVHFMESNK